MPKYVPLPDGSSVTVREGETPEQAYMRAVQMYPEAFGRKEERKEPTIGGQVGEFFKGVLPGGIGALESAAVGASALLPEQYEKSAREGIASIAKAAAINSPRKVTHNFSSRKHFCSCLFSVYTV